MAFSLKQQVSCGLSLQEAEVGFVSAFGPQVQEVMVFCVVLGPGPFTRLTWALQIYTADLGVTVAP